MKMEYSRHESARLFENSFLETCSKVHPATPFLFYIPIVLGLTAYGLLTGTTSWVSTAAFMPLGWLTWMVMEYCIHRFFFHWEGNGPFTRKLHEIVHGYHHKYPDDSDRLVMPLGASIPLGIVVGGLLWLVGRPSATLPLFCGIVVGYLVYDYLHWWTHAKTPKTDWGKALRAHHMAHHFAVTDKNYGISHRWIDALVGTLKHK